MIFAALHIRLRESNQKATVDSLERDIKDFVKLLKANYSDLVVENSGIEYNVQVSEYREITL